ncbi:WXG100 family type VII secretion target [Mycobacterium sp. M1]|uniref:WXG100 family type VII secretion target n=1 Tax=Mycolicibacter acidiphilus TaxID=2835306 RepID=A0ABS5RIA3_9MYCO|nr:WXG100 family type VII secretion target [Mycolicibacter acidiphilus]MBS9534037.1 WXG100 family type VII secretion target [Mycolicibacter acidiphilus]
MGTKGVAMADATGGGVLRVEADSVLAAVGEFRSIADELADGLGQLVCAADSVLGISWRGAAASAFDRDWVEFHDAAKAVVGDADTIADLVAYSVQVYGEQDETSAAVVRSVWVRSDS